MAEISCRDIIVNLGCGTGRSTEIILRSNPKKVIGVDSSEFMLEKAEAKFSGNSKFESRYAKAEDIGNLFTDVDKIFSISSFPYFSDHKKVLLGVYQALTSGGVYLFNTTMREEEYESVHTRTIRAFEEILQEIEEYTPRVSDMNLFEPRYSSKELKKLFDETGFEIKTYAVIPRTAKEEAIKQQRLILLEEFEQLLKQNLQEETARRLIEKLRLKFQNLESEDPKHDNGERITGLEAFLCLKKAA